MEYIWWLIAWTVFVSLWASGVAIMWIMVEGPEEGKKLRFYAALMLSPAVIFWAAVMVAARPLKRRLRRWRRV